MSFFHAEPKPFSVVRKNDLIVLENPYVRCVHDLKLGGMLSEAVIKNGSGENLFAHPQAFLIVTKLEKRHVWKTGPAKFTQAENGGNPVLKFTSRFIDSEGNELENLKLHLQVEYTPWGEARFHAVLDASERIYNIAQLQISTLYPSREMNCLAIQKSLPTNWSA